MDIDTDQQAVNLETLRNNSPTTLNQVETTQLLSLPFQKSEENLWMLETGYIPYIIEQLDKGNTIIYIIPEEHVIIGNESIVMEIETIRFPEDQEQVSEEEAPTTTEEAPTTTETGIQPIETSRVTEALQVTETLPPTESTGSEIIMTGGITGEETTQAVCEQYTTKKECNDINGCLWNRKDKICNLEDILYTEEKYQINITDPVQMRTASEIKITSKKTKQKINGYLQIHKNTKLSTTNS